MRFGPVVLDHDGYEGSTRFFLRLCSFILRQCRLILDMWSNEKNLLNFRLTGSYLYADFEFVILYGSFSQLVGCGRGCFYG